MSESNSLRRFLLPCCFHNGATASSSTRTLGTTDPIVVPPKKRFSISLRDDIPEEKTDPVDQCDDPDAQSTFSDFFDSSMISMSTVAPRPSKAMVIGTIFGHRRGHVWFCIQHNRLKTRPALLIEFSMFTHQLVQEMRCGLVRIALECDQNELGSCPLRHVPVWTMYCNGRKFGFALKRKANERLRSMLKMMQSTTVGAGVLPSGFGSSNSGSELEEELTYMRANYEHVVGSANSESFHLINPDECPGQELSVFLLRSTNEVSQWS